MLLGKKNLVAHTSFYRKCQGMFVLLVFILYVYYIHMLHMRTNVIMFTIPSFIYSLIILARITIPIVMLWSLCYFGQLIPKIGSKLISLERMLMDLGSFLIVLAITTLSFVHAFQAFVSANSKTGCVKEFSNWWQTFYTLFRMMLNMYDTTSVDLQNIGLF